MQRWAQKTFTWWAGQHVTHDWERCLQSVWCEDSTPPWLTDGLLFKIYPHCAGDGISNDEGRRRQVVGSGVGMNSTLKVSVPWQDTSSNQVPLRHQTTTLVNQYLWTELRAVTDEQKVKVWWGSAGEPVDLLDGSGLGTNGGFVKEFMTTTSLSTISVNLTEYSHFSVFLGCCCGSHLELVNHVWLYFQSLFSESWINLCLMRTMICLLTQLAKNTKNIDKNTILHLSFWHNMTAKVPALWPPPQDLAEDHCCLYTSCSRSQPPQS